jgi:hypothetical protein
MRKSGQQGVPEPFRFHIHQHILRRLNVMHTLERNGRQGGEGVELLALFR